MNVLETIRKRQKELIEEEASKKYVLENALAKKYVLENALAKKIEFFKPVRNAINQLAKAEVTYKGPEGAINIKRLAENAWNFSLVYKGVSWEANYQVGVKVCADINTNGEMTILLNDTGGLNPTYNDGVITFLNASIAAERLMIILAPYVTLPEVNVVCE